MTANWIALVADHHEQSGLRAHREGLVYVAFGGETAYAQGKLISLGWGIERKRRTWAWYAAMGYVSGYPVSAILYWLITRKTTARIYCWAARHEGRHLPCRPGCKKCEAAA